MIKRLSGREKAFIVLGIGVVLGVVFWLGIYAPVCERIDLADKKIARREAELQEVLRLRERYSELETVVAGIDFQLKKMEKGFSLFALVEEITDHIGVRDNLVAMRPQKSEKTGGYKEEAVEIRLEKIDLQQLVRLLHAIESSDAFLRMRMARTKPRFDNRSLLDVVLVISSLQRSV